MSKKAKIITTFLLIISSLWLKTAQAALDIELTQGVAGAIPIVVLPFAGQGTTDQSNAQLAGIIHHDLANSGRFKVFSTAHMSDVPTTPAEINQHNWRKNGVDHIVYGKVTPLPNGKLSVSFDLMDAYRNKTAKHSAKNKTSSHSILITKQFDIDTSQLRSVAHRISDIIYQQLTGDRGVFSTKIAYVTVRRDKGKRPRYALEVADADGHNPKPLLTSTEPIMSPSWSPHGKRIAFVSFEHKQPQVYIQHVRTGKRIRVAAFPGINSAPAWSPDATQLAVVLSKNGSPNIFLFDLATKHFKQLTKGNAINTEPSWAPDGKTIVFTSNRSGGPQLYEITVANKKISRLTYDGNYNARGSYTADGKKVVMMHREKNNFGIATLDLPTGRFHVLTRSWLDESPSVSPNGKMILYATNVGGRGVLGVVSIDGRVKIRFPAKQGSVQEPAWSPFLS